MKPLKPLSLAIFSAFSSPAQIMGPMFVKSIASVGAMGVALSLSGCVWSMKTDASSAQTEVVAEQQSAPEVDNLEPEAVKDVSKEVEPQTNLEQPKPIHNAISEQQLNGEQMAAILLAEVMLRRGQVEGAFDLYYEVAEQTADPKVLKRTFELSMGTYNVDKIRMATLLWKENEPKSDVAWRASFLLNLREGRVDQAFSDWQTYQKLSAASFDQDVLLSAQRIATSATLEDGLAFLEKMAQAYPDNWSVHYAMGAVAGAHKVPQLAIEAFLHAAKLADEKELSGIYQSLAALYLESQLYAQGIEALLAYVEQYPKDYLVQERLARMQVLSEDFVGAKQRYEMILSESSDSDKVRLSLALLQIELKEYAEAIQSLDVLLATSPVYKSIAYYYKGMSQQELKLYDEALSSFAKVQDENYAADARLHRAEILFAQQKTDKAFEELNQMSVDKPENAIKQLRAKAIFSVYQARFAEAVAFYDQALLIQPQNTTILLAQSYLLYNLERFDAYEQTLRKVLEVQPDNVEALNGLGYFFAEQGRNLDEAKLLLEKAVQLAPKNYFVLDSLGWVLFKQGSYAQAIGYLEQAFAIEKDEEVFVHLIQVYIANQETPKAQELWQNYAEELKNSESVQKLKAQLPVEFFEDLR